MEKEAFLNKLTENPRPVVVDFWAPWCGPCRSIQPVLARLEKEYEGRLDLWRVNADDNPELLRSLRIFSIPTLVVYRAGQEAFRQVGAQSPVALAGLFDAGLNGVKPTPVELSFFERGLRLLAGLGLVGLGYSGGFNGVYLLLAGLGLGVMFSAVYDHCPVWRAVSRAGQALLQRLMTVQK